MVCATITILDSEIPPIEEPKAIDTRVYVLFAGAALIYLLLIKK